MYTLYFSASLTMPIVISFLLSLVFGLTVVLVLVLVLLFYVLASGDAFLSKMVQVTPTLADKKKVVSSARDIWRHISIYLATVTLINIVVGIVVGNCR